MPPNHSTPATAALLAPTTRLSRFARRVSLDGSGHGVVGRHHIYILPTGFGALYGATILVLLFGSQSAQNNSVLLFAFLLAALGLVGMVHTWRALVGLRVRIGDAQPVFGGHQARFPVQISDPRGRERPGVILMAGEVLLPLALGAGDRARGELLVSTRERGPHRLGQVRIEALYPLALFRAWSYLDCPAGVLVYPRPAAAVLDGNEEATGREQARRGISGTGLEEFLGLRAYRPGDPLTRLHWKAIARADAFLVKDFGGEQGEVPWFAWDTLAPAEPELRLSLLCRQVIEAEARGVRYGLRLPALCLQPSAGAVHRHQCLDALARFPSHDAD